MEKPDMILVIGSAFITVCLGALALASLAVGILYGRIDSFFIALSCVLLMCMLIHEIRKELDKNK